MAFNSVTIQNLTYTETSLGNLPTITYTNDGLAGFETVTVSGSPANISVSMQSGVSTANQIKAAVQANFIATRLVTVTGASASAQVSCVNQALSGGTDLATATLVVGGVLKLTAASSGTAGNAVTFGFTGGGTAGSEVVTVTSSDISVQIEDGVTTWDQLVTAYNAVMAATSLATLSSAGPALSGMASEQVSIGPVPDVFSPGTGLVYVAMAPAPDTHLAGGTALVAAHVTNQGVTYTAVTAGTAGNSLRVSLSGGATAGAEVVTETATTLNTQIQIGTSTVSQIVTANAGDVFFAVTGSASTHPLTVNALSMSGGTPSLNFSFLATESSITLTTSYVFYPFGFTSDNVHIHVSDTTSSHVLLISLDGVTEFDHLNGTSVAASGYAVNGASERDYSNLHVNGVWLAYSSGTPTPFDVSAFSNGIQR